jgi:hypothetical protein
MKNRPEIILVNPLEGYRLYLKYDTGEEGIVDLNDIKGKGVFKIWNDWVVFLKARIVHHGRAIEWPDEVDLCAESLRLQMKPLKSIQQSDNAAA